MANKTFLIEVVVYDVQDFVLFEGTMRAKNKENEFVAKCGLEEHLKKKHATFDRMVVKSCKEENPFNNIFGNGIFDSFNDIFKGFKK